MSNRLGGRQQAFNLNLNPPPPERGGGPPRRVHVPIELIEMPRREKRPGWESVISFWIIAIVILGLLWDWAAQARPTPQAEISRIVARGDATYTEFVQPWTQGSRADTAGRISAGMRW